MAKGEEELAKELLGILKGDPAMGHTLRRGTAGKDELLTIVGPDHDRAAKTAISALRNDSVLRSAAPSFELCFAHRVMGGRALPAWSLSPASP